MTHRVKGHSSDIHMDANGIDMHMCKHTHTHTYNKLMFKK